MWRILGACLVTVAACRPPAPAAEPGAPRVLAYSITMQNRPAGSIEIRIAADGTRDAELAFSVRGAEERSHTELVLDAAGAPRRFRATGRDHFGQPIDERLDDAGGALRWQSPVEHGQAPAGSGWYLPLTDAGDLAAVLARALLGAPGHRLALLPAGEAWIDDDTARELPIAGAVRRLRRIAVAGLGFEPVLIWLDEDGELFAAVSAWQSTIRRGAEAAIPALVADDQAWIAARAAGLAARLAHRPPPAGLAIVHARRFDAERRTVVPDATVIVSGDRITAVGDATTPVPPGAQVIDAHGRTLLPGLWDMHVHLHEGEGVLDLASGITTVRDLGNDLDELAARVARYDAGRELGPRVVRAGLLDGPSEPYTAGIGLVAGTREQAVAAVARFADTGHVQIKIDPTLTVFHDMFTADPGELDPVYVPYEKRLPAQVTRGARSGGLAAHGGERAGFRASYEALLRMVKLARDRGIPIATGTDYLAGVGLPHELELYVQAGIPPADVLALATLGDARIMGMDRDTGSIAPGKRADLVLVDGDPTRDIAAVRRTDAVVCRGVIYDPAELFAAAGMRPR